MTHQRTCTTESLAEGLRFWGACGALLTPETTAHWSEQGTCEACRQSSEWQAQQIDTRHEGT